MKKITLVLTVLLLMYSTLIFAAEEDVEQYGNGSAFARISSVEGTVNVKRDVDLMEGVAVNFVVESMDVIKTEFTSRAVIQFIDGSLLKLGENSKIDFLKIGGEDNNFSFLVRVWQGKVYADISEDDSFKEREFRFDTKDASVYLLSSGKYRVDINDYESNVKTIAGLAEISINNGSKLVRAGEVARIDGSSQSVSINNFNTFLMDDFGRWASSTNNRQLTESAQYVPNELKHYVSDLDSSGSWYYDTEVSTYVWRPAVITLDWTPYSNGYWAYSPYGSTWVSNYSWGYAPFHYGSWYFSGSLGWCWSPGSYYSPAWVSWSCWDNYVGWYPYGYHNHHHGNGRGVVVRNDIRDRVVCVPAHNLYNRHVTGVRGVVPSRGTVVRTVKPIAPRPSSLTSKPIKSITTSINHPVKVNSVRNVQIKPIKSGSTSVPVRTTSTVKPIRTGSPLVKPQTPGRTIGTTNSSKPISIVTPSRTVGTSSKPIKTTPSRTVKPTTVTPKSTTVTPKSTTGTRTVKPKGTTSSSTKEKSIKIKSPTVRDRYVKPQSSFSSRSTTVKSYPYRAVVKTPTSSSSSSGSGYSRTVKPASSAPSPSRSYTTVKTSSTSYSKPSSSSSGSTTSYSKPSSSPSKSYTTSSKSSSSTGSTSSTTSSSSNRSSRRR